MSVKWEKLEGHEGVLTVEVDAKKVDEGLDAAFKKVVKNITVPGFRKGKVPRVIFEKRFGVEALYQDALDILLPEAYAKAVEEAGIEPVDVPKIDIEQMEKGKNLIFTARVTVKPEVKLGQYKGLEVEKMDATVTDEDVENELKRLQEDFAELVVKEDGKIEKGDTAVIDFEGFVDGEPFEGGKAENYSLEIGSGVFIPGFEDQLVGMKAGEEKEIEVTFPEEYHAKELAGKPATFKVKVHEVKAKQLPALDDEFAKDVDDEVETLEQLKEKIRARLEETKKNEAETALRDAVVEKAAENAEIDIPEVMVKNETDRMLREFDQRLQMQGLNLDLYYQFSGQDEAALREQMKEDAEKRVRVALTLEAIAKAEHIEVTEEEVNEELEKMAKAYNLEVEKLKELLGNLEGVKEDLKWRKTIDFLVEHSKVAA
ncbi:trigger factor [Parageobacillus thermoglucosidasius]|uniref:Trigger factor n=2 Tax=Parageobacillus thermoglucosidasius TaxID=1426 RepID=A0AAN0YR33_PARTM|nr:trigger factor [Parageobacillus thermoglucosidasius]REK55797.1 MAG: trigger factor [Geobacillus sp.]ALF11707.1 trigger factor [Parageobacillus thermoglucosidasius]ANZ31790.1 trigger factor [Parageobacillus thermoglucosidasius]APM82525.1 trigger factor [Parageobacillus thermoglucosidasius]KJX69555.1 trigger factor [Parageobacillus thermoglucosidasius]